MMKYTQTELKSKLIRQVLTGTETVIYYSLVKKQAKTLSFLSNDRLLVYDSNRRILFYNNDYQNTPFRTVIPQPKSNVFSPISHSDFSNPVNTNNIQVRYTSSNTKGDLETLEWIFTCDSKQLTIEWINLLNEEKLVEKATGQKNAGFIHDTLLQAMKSNSPPKEKETILKPEQQVIKPINQPQNSQLKKSKLSDPRQSQLQQSNANIAQSNLRTDPKPIEQGSIAKPKQNINNSGVQPGNSIIKPANSIVQPGNSIAQPGNSIVQPGNSMIQSNTNVVQPGNSLVRPGNNVIQSKDPIINSTIKPENSTIKPKQTIIRDNPNQSNTQKKKQSIDWNLRFLRNPTEETIYLFQEEAVKAFMTVWQRDCSSLHQYRRIYQSQGLRISIANCFSKDASQLKRQFRNYHFIMQACKNKLVVGVPLCALIEWQGTVALIKAPIPIDAHQVRLNKVVPQVRQLERYTRVANTILQKGILWDLTDLYGPNGDRRLVYVDGLIEYLPIHPDQQLLGVSLRPQYLLDSVGQVIPGGDGRGNNRQQQKQLASACEGLSSCVKELAEYLNEQQTLWADALELKEIFHSFGVNFKLLPRVYEGVGNKQVRRCMQSVMAAKVAKDILTQSMLQSRFEGKKIDGTKLVQEYMRLLMEGNNSNSSQVWKQLNLRFKKQFSAPISNSQLIPGFFLNSLIKLLRVRADPNKLNKTKKPFRQQGVVGTGLVAELQPKVKTYYRFTTQFVEKVRYACRQQKKTDDIHDQIVNQLQLNTKNIPPEYQLNNNYQSVCQYLAYYTPPADLDPKAPLQHLRLYNSILIQPPSAFSLRITKAYLQWAIKKDKTESFKKTIEQALKISEYWLEQGHIHQADLIQILSDFYASQGNAEESINFMKQSLSKTIRNCGVQSRQAGNRYYQLGQRQLKAGRKRQALQSFAKAKSNMQAHQSTSIKYPLLMMRTSSLQLNNGRIEPCIEGALQAIKQFDQYDRRSGSGSITEGYKVKTFQVLARAYEITGRKAQLRSMATICAKKFNRSHLEWTFEQMIRICLAAALFTHSQDQCQIFMDLCIKLAQDEHPIQPHAALKQLMGLSQTIVVMDKFLARFDYIERVVAEMNSKKPLIQETTDFLLITKWVAAAVGQDYIQGLIQQKQYE